jgi:NADH-quinone oxidoreductase subunit N
MNQTDLIAIFPELVLFAWVCVLLVADLFLADRTWIHRGALLGLAVLAMLSTGYLSDGNTIRAFDNSFVNDPLANLLKIGAYLATAITLVMSRSYLEERGLLKGEFYGLALCSLVGQMIMISSSNVLTVYLGLELMSLALYALVALHRDNRVATESAMKYFILGALASGFLLYGISMLYGATGTFDIATIAKVLSTGQANKSILGFALVFIVAGLSFKLGLAPFHMWVPDVYQGAPTAVTLLLAGAPKIAALALMIRILVEGLGGIATIWQPMLWSVAIASLVIGNLTAIVQTNLKRMLAYSTISHMGFVVLGLSALVASKDSAVQAYSASVFYMLTYVLTTLGTFGLILMLSRKDNEAENIDDLRGLNSRRPGLALLMLILMFSLTGIPPTVGFYAKLAVLQALISAGQIWLAVIAVMASLVGAFYYLRVVKAMYFDARVSPDESNDGSRQGGQLVVLTVTAAATLVLGIFPGALLDLCALVFKGLLGA